MTSAYSGFAPILSVQRSEGQPSQRRGRPSTRRILHAGKADVDKNDVGPECLGFRQCLSAVVNKVIVADLLQHQAEGVGYI